MGNRVTCVVRSATEPAEGVAPAAAGDDAGTTVTGLWEVQYLLPFCWAGFVPAAFWTAHGARLTEAMAEGAAPEPPVTDIVVAWSVAEQAYASRLDGIVAAVPELEEPARRFLEDVRSVADRTEHPVVHLCLDELVEMSWDEDDLGRYVTDVVREAGLWDDPTGEPHGELTDLPTALASAEPDRSFLLGGEWTHGGSAAPRARPPALPRPVE
ncbi:hypothetical protein [Curtobacterium sp. PhB115]|uniref:hypothetical protein n=1 Tax=Curtobacterium sp. PhB115 TaxID=2485173 RepID=UPI000F4CFE56|nr:hypothetical protein [Curtobacterium sp. PhB115]